MSPPTQIGIINRLPLEHPDGLLRQAIGRALPHGAPEPLALQVDAPDSELRQADVLLLAAPPHELPAAASRAIRLGLDLFVVDATHLSTQGLSALSALASEAQARVGFAGLLLPLMPAPAMPYIAPIIVEARRDVYAVGQRADIAADLGTLMALCDVGVAVRSVRQHSIPSASPATLMVLVEMANGTLLTYLQQRSDHRSPLQVAVHHGGPQADALVEASAISPLSHSLELFLGTSHSAGTMLKLALRTALLMERMGLDARFGNQVQAQ
ncbi:MAG: hypothetical protein IJU72_00905 [Bacteroidales bacterium]|nr:hypothetical protein [Bacteroidales bacterium]